MVDPKQFFIGRKWYVTGDFVNFSREQIIEIIKSNGGLIVDDILKANHILALDEAVTGNIPDEELKKLKIMMNCLL